MYEGRYRLSLFFCSSCYNKLMSKKKTGSVGRTLYYFWKALMQCKFRFISLSVMMILSMFLSRVLVPAGMSEIIGKISEGDFELAGYTVVLLMTILPQTFYRLVLIRAIDWLDWSIDAIGGEYLAKISFDAVINQSMTFHSNHFSGSLTSQVNKFINAFVSLKSAFTWNIMPLVLTILFTIGAAFLTCPPFALIMIVYAIVFFAVNIIIYRKTSYREEEMAEADNKLTGQLADAITNVTSVKSYAREPFEQRRFMLATGRKTRAIFGLAKVSFQRNMTQNVIDVMTSAGVIVLLVLSHDWFGLDVAGVVFLYSIMHRFIDEMWNTSNILRTINRAFGDAKSMTEILDMPFIIDDKTDKPIKVEAGEIDFSHVSFRHEEQKGSLFSDFSLKIPAGSSVGLVGISGSGKTTLTKLLLRFADVDKGAIYIDGQDIKDVTQRSLREAIAYVPQESSLFHRSVFENIAYGRPDATDEEVYEAARLANADEFIEHLPDGYDTMVGERGVKLSGGQRQRIAIARAILKDAPILVLDEATSALDSESEALIQEALANLMEGRTSIVVAHRLSTIANLDEIVVLNDGEIVEQGKHSALLKASGEYAKLWSRQSGAFLDEKKR